MSFSGQYSRVISTLGQGIGLQPEFFDDLLAGARPSVDFMQLSSDYFAHAGARGWAVATRVRQQMPVTLHGHGLCLGDARGPGEGYLSALADLAERLEPVLVSDRACWTSQAGRFSHCPLPLPRTAAVLRRLVDNVSRAQERLKRRIMVGNVASYVEFAENEMSESELLRELAAQADCWILLDVTAAYVNGHNHGRSAEEFVEGLPRERIQQLHVGGHSRFADGPNPPLLVDSRASAVAEGVWGLFRASIRHCGHAPVAIQWEAPVPSLERVVAESGRARLIAGQVPLRRLSA